MYSSIRISGYRGLDSFRMERLGRVNLLVGMNNSGKTSILECIELLRSAGDPHVLPSIARRRGELGFTGYRLSGTSFAITALRSGMSMCGRPRFIRGSRGRTRRVCDCTKPSSMPSWTL